MISAPLGTGQQSSFTSGITGAVNMVLNAGTRAFDAFTGAGATKAMNDNFNRMWGSQPTGGGSGPQFKVTPGQMSLNNTMRATPAVPSGPTYAQ